MVRADGVEPVLRRLYVCGVYLTNEESKGRQPDIRGGRTFNFNPGMLTSRFAKGSLQTSTSGSRGSPVSTTMRLDRVAYVSFCHAEMFAAHGLEGRSTLLWMPILPSGAGLTHLLQLCKMRVPPVRWFSPVAATSIRPALSKRFATLYIVHAGTVFVTGREPLTPAKNAEIERAGAKAINLYAFSEGGIVGFGCAGEKRACDRRGHDVRRHRFRSSHRGSRARPGGRAPGAIPPPSCASCAAPAQLGEDDIDEFTFIDCSDVRAHEHIEPGVPVRAGSISASAGPRCRTRSSLAPRWA